MITAIVVSYESGSYLERCLGSLESLAEEGHEIVVVDNASSDGSAELAREGFPFCRVMALDRNIGFGAANNLAAREASGDCLLLVNPDAWLEEGCVKALAAVLQSSPRLGMVAPTLRYPNGDRQFSWNPTRGVVGESVQRFRNRFEKRAWAHGPCARLLRALGDPGWLSASCALVRRQAWDAVGGFDEDFFLYFEDVDLGARLAAAGWDLAEIRDATAFHEKGTTLSNKLAYRESQFLHYAKHRPRWENRFLVRKQRRKFSREIDPEYRRQLLEIVDRAAERMAQDRYSA